MRSLAAILCLASALFSPNLGRASEAKKARTAYPVTYEGGSLPLNRHKAEAMLGKDEVVFVQHNHRIAVPLKDITQISCGSEVHRRLMRLGEAETHYVGVTWTGSTRAPGKAVRVEALLRLSNGDYREFLTTLEQLTGMRAIDTNQVPTVVRYDL